MTDRIELTDPKDLAFAKIAQGSLVNCTVLPSGFKTPAQNMIIKGTTLVATCKTTVDIDRERDMRRFRARSYKK